MDAPTAPLARKKLPIGLQTLAKLRGEGCYYVDKTGQVIDLIESGAYFFLSRPRRFGKSLLIDTFKELFEGNRALFAGLAAEHRWDWSRHHPVIRISFGGGVARNGQEIDYRIQHNLRSNRAALGLPLPDDVPPGDFAGNLSSLIEQAHHHFGQPVVVLVDEYDKPILDNLTEPEMARTMRERLKNLYIALKESDAHLKFVFLTGVSKFSKVGLFSGLNNLKDITLDARYSTLCGYTDHDIDTVFAPELPGLDREQIRRWYNGYHWLGEGVYNPFDALLFFDTRVFKPYWFETGTPTFLVDVLRSQCFFTPRLGRMLGDDDLLSSFDVDLIAPEALLFQAGYLTISGVTINRDGEPLYTLGYPNHEVEVSLNRALLAGYGVSKSDALNLRELARTLFDTADFEGLRTQFHALFASIPSDWYRNNRLSEFEGHYASVFYSHLAGMGLHPQVEDATSLGRIDLSLLVAGRVYIFEFKVVEHTAQGYALRQIREKGYADKYRARHEPIHLIGVEFGKAERNIVGFEVETLVPPGRVLC